MGLKIADLLKWRKSVILKDYDGNPILDGKNPVEVWLRVIGDDDLDAAHRKARIASASKRKELRDNTSMAWKDRVEPIMGATKEDCAGVLMQYRTANLPAEARANIPREELPTIDEVSVEPDAPTLEEMENLDHETLAQEKRYQDALEDYINTRTEVIAAEIEAMDLDEIRTTTMEEISGVIALAEFFNVLLAEKVVRGAFTDKNCKEPAFESVEEFNAAETIIRQQLMDAYTELEYDPDAIKK